MTAAKLRPPFPYYGGKQGLARQIADLLPAHEHYVESHAGSAAVLFAKAPSRQETVNDLDGDLITFWRTLRDKPDELERVCALTPHSRAELAIARDRPLGLPDLERARRVWVHLTQGRGASLGGTSGWRHDIARASGPLPRILAGLSERLAPAADRLSTVSLEGRPALEIIASYGASPDVCLYVDPPYLRRARSRGGQRYGQEADSLAEHAELVDALEGCAAAVVLSGYPDPLYDDRLAGWSRREFAAVTSQGGSHSPRTEVIWCNRPFSDPQLSLFD